MLVGAASVKLARLWCICGRIRQTEVLAMINYTNNARWNVLVIFLWRGNNLIGWTMSSVRFRTHTKHLLLRRGMTLASLCVGSWQQRVGGERDCVCYAGLNYILCRSPIHFISTHVCIFYSSGAFLWHRQQTVSTIVVNGPAGQAFLHLIWLKHNQTHSLYT